MMCPHTETIPARLVNGQPRSRCASCGVEFATIFPKDRPPEPRRELPLDKLTPSGRRVRKWAERQRRKQIENTRAALFGNDRGQP